MAIDLKAALAKKLPPKQSGEVFSFTVPGDQLIFTYIGRRTVVVENRPSELIDCEVLAGEQTDPKTKKVSSVKRGPMVFFLSAQSKRIFDSEKPISGDVIQLQLVEIRADARGMKVYGFEYLDKRPRPEGEAEVVGGPDPDDNIPDFLPEPEKSKARKR